MKRMGVIGWPEEEKTGRAGAFQITVHTVEAIPMPMCAASFLFRGFGGWARPPELAAAKEQEICGRTV